MRAIGEVVLFAAAVHGPIIPCLRQIGQHSGIDFIGKDAVEHQVVEWRIGIACRIHRRDEEIAQLLDRRSFGVHDSTLP
jgi:hypothetical protein